MSKAPKPSPPPWSLLRRIWGMLSCPALGLLMGACTAHFEEGAIPQAATNIGPFGFLEFPRALAFLAESSPWHTASQWVFLLGIFGGLVALIVRGIMVLFGRTDAFPFILLVGLAMAGAGIFSEVAANAAVRAAAPQVLTLYETFKNSPTIYCSRVPGEKTWAFYDPSHPTTRVLMNLSAGLSTLDRLFPHADVKVGMPTPATQ
jgi:hypothetical protein